MTAFSVPATNVIVVGASAGGIAAVRTLLNKFPENVPAAIFVVVHTSPDGPGKLASVLDRATRLTVVTAEDGMVARHGHVYVAPPDYHLIVDGRYVCLGKTEAPNPERPGTDALRTHDFKGPPSPFTCPDRGGTLWENIELRSRMRVRATDQRLTAFSGKLDQDIADMKQRAAALRRLLLDPREHAPTRSRSARKRQSHG